MKLNFFFIFVLLLLISLSQASRLVNEYMNFLKKILQETHKTDELNADTLTSLLQLIEGHPKYNRAGAEFILEKVGQKSFTFEIFEKIVDKIYGDLISDDPFQPQEVHIALTNSTQAMNVMWTTMKGLVKPHVEFLPSTLSDWSLASTAEASSWTYTVPKKWWPIFEGSIYGVNMEGLEEGKSYKYRVGGFDPTSQTNKYSKEYTFRAAPTASPDRSTKAFTVADHGTFMLYGWETVKKMLMVMEEGNYKPDFVFAAGDLSYAGLSTSIDFLNIDKEDEFELVWDLLGIQNEPVAGQVPWMVGNGNHERFYDWAAFKNRFTMPSNSEEAFTSNLGFWYTFTQGNIRWVQISSEHDLSEGSTQNIFLNSVLEEANKTREQFPWVILSIHKPLYCSIDGGPRFADALEDILIKYKVDLTITGHMHAYERIHPVKDSVVSLKPVKQFMHDGIHDKTVLSSKKVDVYYTKDEGPVHVMQGNAGGFQFERFSHPSPEWSAFRMSTGFVIPDFKRSVTEEYKEINKNIADTFDLSDNTLMTNEDIYDYPLVSKPDIDVSFNYSHTYGFGAITAINSTHLHYRMIPNVDGQFNHDEFWIVKNL